MATEQNKDSTDKILNAEDSGKELVKLLIGADLRQKSLIYDLRHSYLPDQFPVVNLMDEVFRWFGFEEDVKFILEEMYEAYVSEKLESLDFKNFRLRLNETAEELFILLNTVKTLQKNRAISQ